MKHRTATAGLMLLLISSACVASTPSNPPLGSTTTAALPNSGTNTSAGTVDELPEGDGSPIRFPDDAGVIDVQVAYGATGDGVTDDTAALRRAIAENVGRNRILYLPPGTYLVSDTLEWRDQEGRWQPYLTLQGAGRDHTVIRLADRSWSFGAPEQPKAVVKTGSGLFGGEPDQGYLEDGEGNEGFRNYVFDLAIDTGTGNPGAIGVDFLANNNGGVGGVTIRSGDGAGVAGLSMTRKYPGPALIKDVTIEGFDIGVATRWTEYGLTLEDLRLSGQRVAGIRNEGNVLSIHGMFSDNEVPAVENVDPAGLVALVDARLEGGAPTQSAIVNQGLLYVRSVTAAGYRSAIAGRTGLAVEEHAHPQAVNLLSAPQEALKLPIEETPDPRWGDPADWASVGDETFAGGADPTDEEDDTAAIQAALDSGSETIYFPASGMGSQGRYLISDTLVVPAAVRRIVGFQSFLLPAPGFSTDAGVALFRFEGSTTHPVVVDRLVIARNGERSFPTGFLQASDRPVALLNLNVTAELGLRTSAASGPVFLEDYCCASIELGPDGRVWARQLNLEGGGLKLANAGSALWVLGLKTEKPSTVIRTTNGGQTELSGGLLYPVEPVAQDVPAFSVGSTGKLSLTYVVSAYLDQARNYLIQVEAVQEDRTERLVTPDVPSRGFGSGIPLYRGP